MCRIPVAVRTLVIRPARGAVASGRRAAATVTAVVPPTVSSAVAVPRPESLFSASLLSSSSSSSSSWTASAAAMVVAAASLAVVTNPAPSVTYNHCQVPCGIFDDPAMVAELQQASQTIRKAMLQSKQGFDAGELQDLNQVVRWIVTKEDHCNKIIKVISEYCLCQRVKRETFGKKSDYYHALELHHAVMQAAMKCKQTMDIAACDALDQKLADLAKMYTS